MRRADRLFDILQTLRVATGPMTAATLAERLEVTPRTVYRDIATLQARRIPIEGAAGIGYVLRRGFDLPPLMFTADEVNAIALGVRLVRRQRDPALHNAADSVLAKLATVVPEALRAGVSAAPFFVAGGYGAAPTGIDLAELRRAIRECRKLHLLYANAQGQRSARTVWPVAMAYWGDATLLGAWCELRDDFRHFRVERIIASHALEAGFPVEAASLRNRWFALQHRPATPLAGAA